MPVKVKFLHEDAKMPFYGSEEAAGFDLYAVEDVLIEPGERVMIGTGVGMSIPEGYCFKFRDRSGLGAKGVTHFGGLIDSDYRGEFKVVLFNSSKEGYKIEKGDRIIQAVIVPVMRAEFEKIDELEGSGRGEGGFHSTGKK
ncbi:dUTP diphosphatase [Candidatus Pacearchaeota archaeon]|nr:dUTP diphosphatase [Candidatus Pacearchaeota archaeon]